MPYSALPLCALLLFAAPVRAQAAAHVVELFTSEGCSSCPPAEALIGRLPQHDVIALSLHVSYWDDLGWRDQFALPEALARQRQYAQTLHLSSLYTPQAVIDGERDVLASSARGIADAIKEPRSGVAVKLSVTAQLLSVALDAQPVGGAQDVWLLSYRPRATTQVTRGENAGKALQEFNIVRSLRRLGQWQGRAETFSVPLSRLPADAGAVAVLIQAPGQGAIRGAAVQALRPSVVVDQTTFR